VSRALIVLGLLLVAVGLTWRWLPITRFGRLPGDIIIERPGFTFYIPVTTCILISAIASALYWLLKR